MKEYSKFQTIDLFVVLICLRFDVLCSNVHTSIFVFHIHSILIEIGCSNISVHNEKKTLKMIEISIENAVCYVIASS